MITDRFTSTNMAAERIGSARAVRVLVGLSLFIHVLLHALPGMLSTGATNSQTSIWIWTAAWTISSICTAGAAYGLWGWAWFARKWRGLLAAGALTSLMLLLASGHPYAWFGMLLDLFYIGFACLTEYEPPIETAKARHPFWSILVRFLAGLFLAYGGLVIATRPWQQNWGAMPAEMARIFGEDSKADSRDHYLNHVVTVNAPPEKVWPYIVQMGQDKAGFYSYSWLERAFGDHITNTYQVRLQWQNLREGDTINLTQPGYFFGLMEEGVPLKVEKLIPNRLLQLEGWGTFWVEPLPGGKSRFGVHTSVGDDIPLWAAPINVFVFEPAHWIMQQKMLRTIRDLAEEQ